ncbi:uroporphyrinogen-III synthase [Buchnera aphidicola]|uniref:uroporphyrinogen-III synthase n=1 Tax=Buchnera aphidicola TaxID=9 RepID=UPI0005C723AD
MLYKNIKKQDKIILLQGENGRNFIQKYLTIQGFKISLIECYKRVLKISDNIEEIKKWHAYHIDTLIITNGETLKELKKIISNYHQAKWLLTCQIFVVGQRLFILAKKLGWKKIIISHYANNEFLLKIIKNNSLNS